MMTINVAMSQFEYFKHFHEAEVIRCTVVTANVTAKH